VGLCARENVYATGLPPEMFSRPPRLIEGVTPAAGALSLRAHALKPDAPVTLAVQSSSTLGAAAAALPGGLSAAQVYYALPLGSDAFSLSLVAGGEPISSFTDAGSGVFGVVVDHGVYLDAAIEAATAIIYQFTRAHAQPIAADVLPFVCAFVAARIYLVSHTSGNSEFAKAGEAPSWIRSLVDKLFDIWTKGAPILGAVDATPTVADNGAQLVPISLNGGFDLEDGRV
jgi:hypothetical protein